MRYGILAIVALAICTTRVTAQKPADETKPEAKRLPGSQSDGRTLLPNQWSLKPAGKQTTVGDFPVNIAVHPSEPFAAVLHCGYGTHEIVVLDLRSGSIASRTTLPQSFYGIAFARHGKSLLVSGGEHETLHEYQFAGGQLKKPREIKVTEDDSTGVVTGIACDHSGDRALVADGWGDKLHIVPLGDDKPSIQHIAIEKNSYPYAVCPTKDDKRIYVSLWGKGAVAVVDPAEKKVIASWSVGKSGVGPATSHPTELALSPDEKLLYVACASNSSVAVVDTATGQTVEQISSALYPNVPSGSTPDSIALSADGKALLIANADNNNVAVLDVTHRGESRSLGFIPVGWYPTSVRFSRDGQHIYVANGKGVRPMANPQGPNPIAPRKGKTQYIGGLLEGTVSVIESPSPQQLAEYSRQAIACSPLRADLSVSAKPPADSPIPAKVGDPSPIKHCLYIIKENRTYDQVFGDIKNGNGDASLCIFGQKVTPNLHALAGEFVLLDNFYVDAEVSADGHEWSNAAYATDFVEKTWPLVYRGGKHAKRLDYPSEGSFDVAQPTTGYLWDRCQEAGVTYRSYGEFIHPATLVTPAKAAVKALEGHFDPSFRGWDLSYPDNKRTDRFIEELHGFEKTGAMPQYMVLRLPNDHTSGTAAGKPTPIAMVAENDLAVGRLVEAVSHSKFWPETAIFIVEDDAQNGSDHVDAHRTTALVISPYCRRHHVDSTLYSTSSMLRTMELILGLKPMTQFDAAATPMYGSFQSQLELKPFDHVPAQTDLTATNKKDAPGAKESAQMDFSREDAADDLALNRVIWQSIRGDEPMPPPTHAAFVRAPWRAADADDD